MSDDSEEDDEDENGAPMMQLEEGVNSKINSKFLSLDKVKRNQTSIIVPFKDANPKKIKELLRIKDEPDSMMNTAAQQAMISKTFL